MPTRPLVNERNTFLKPAPPEAKIGHETTQRYSEVFVRLSVYSWTALAPDVHQG